MTGFKSIGSTALVAVLAAAVTSPAAGPFPDVSEHHGYACITTPCISVTHAGHEFGAALAPIRPNSVLVGVPDEFFSASDRAAAAS